MNKKWFSFEQRSITRYLFYWIIRIVPVSIAVGSLVALFLWLLDLATTARWQHLWIIVLLKFS